MQSREVESLRDPAIFTVCAIRTLALQFVQFGEAAFGPTVGFGPLSEQISGLVDPLFRPELQS